jgi:hypothetical protein
MSDDRRRVATILASRIRRATVRAIFRASIRGRHDEVHALLAEACGPLPAGCDLSDPEFLDDLLDALEYRISPPDDEDPGLHVA